MGYKGRIAFNIGMNQIVKIMLQAEKIFCNLKDILQESSYTFSLKLTVNIKIFYNKLNFKLI